MAACSNHPVNKHVFITVNYNNLHHTLKYLASISNLKSKSPETHIIVVDNNSNPTELAELDKAAADNIHIIRNSENLGYFRALNVGIGYATESIVDMRAGGGHRIIVSNNDVEFEKDFAVTLDGVEYTGDTLVIAPNVVSADGYNENPHCITRLSRLRKLGYRVYVSNYYLGKSIYWFAQKVKGLKGPRKNSEAATPRFIYMGIGACYILTGHFFRHFQELDDRVFLWGEEALLAGQIASVGGRIWYEPTLVVHHNQSSTVSRIPSRKAYDIWRESFKIYSKYL